MNGACRTLISFSGYASCNLAGGTGPVNTEMDALRVDGPRL
jgi:hypothetical protein